LALQNEGKWGDDVNKFLVKRYSVIASHFQAYVVKDVMILHNRKKDLKGIKHVRDVISGSVEEKLPLESEQ
jgi:hypothetical protein